MLFLPPEFYGIESCCTVLSKQEIRTKCWTVRGMCWYLSSFTCRLLNHLILSFITLASFQTTTNSVGMSFIITPHCYPHYKQTWYILCIYVLFLLEAYLVQGNCEFKVSAWLEILFQIIWSSLSLNLISFRTFMKSSLVTNVITQ